MRETRLAFSSLPCTFLFAKTWQWVWAWDRVTKLLFLKPCLDPGHSATRTEPYPPPLTVFPMNGYVRHISQKRTNAAKVPLPNSA